MVSCLTESNSSLFWAFEQNKLFLELDFYFVRGLSLTFVQRIDNVWKVLILAVIQLCMSHQLEWQYVLSHKPNYFTWLFKGRLSKSSRRMCCILFYRFIKIMWQLTKSHQSPNQAKRIVLKVHFSGYIRYVTQMFNLITTNTHRTRLSLKTYSDSSVTSREMEMTAYTRVNMVAVIWASSN